jgi:hypothetical protein
VTLDELADFRLPTAGLQFLIDQQSDPLTKAIGINHAAYLALIQRIMAMPDVSGREAVQMLRIEALSLGGDPEEVFVNLKAILGSLLIQNWQQIVTHFGHEAIQAFIQAYPGNANLLASPENFYLTGGDALGDILMIHLH